MSDSSEYAPMFSLDPWSFPKSLRPDPLKLEFDLEQRLDALLHAYTAPILGTTRSGHGVVIDSEGHILTIGYLVTEAQQIWCRKRDGSVVQADVLAYDQPTGFGILKSFSKLECGYIPIGKANDLRKHDKVYMLGHGGIHQCLKTSIAAVKPFAGSWEYLLEQALFIEPAHPEWSGSPLLNVKGELVGIGSLLTQELKQGQTQQSNMVVPIDLLVPILNNLIKQGHSGLPPRPWLGLYLEEHDEQLVVQHASPQGPAEEAGILPEDLLVSVAGQRVQDLANFYRHVWSIGQAGVEVPLQIARGAELMTINIRSINRSERLIKPTTH
jgi:S1-C subfamily serine protease